MAPQLPPDNLDLVVYEWKAGRLIHRVHPSRYAPASFNPSRAPARFRPVYAGLKQATVVPTIYGGSNFKCALSESVFHDVPLEGFKHIALSELAGRVRSVLIPQRPLRLAELHGAGLTRLGRRARDLTDFDDEGYEITRAWGQKIYDWRRPDGSVVDGIVWMSRQFNSEPSLMLFGSVRGHPRVGGKDLKIEEAESRIPLDAPDTLKMVWSAGNRAGILVGEPGDS